MKEEFIKIETAILAKEKGFNSHTDEVYAEQREHSFYDPRSGKDYVFEQKPHRIISTRYIEENYINIINAPTQSLLQKWLRKVHDILVYVDPKSHHVFQYHIITNDDEIIGSEKSNDWEKTLEAGLLEALKLLP